MSAIGMVRERDAQAQAHSERSGQMRITDYAVRVPLGAARKLPQASQRLSILFNVQRRRWLVDAAATLCVLGGFITAPLLTLLAWIGLMLPAGAPLHSVASTLLVIAIIWLSLALISAHIHHNRRHEADR